MERNIEEELKQKGLPNFDWLQEGCYHDNPADLISMVRRKWDKYTQEEKDYMSRIYSYPGGYFKINNDKKMSVEVKCDKQIAAELLFYKDISKDMYSEVLDNHNIELTDFERRYIDKVVENELEQQNSLNI